MIKILVADDNPVIRKMLSRILESEKAYEICAEAADGREAIDLAVEYSPELIILDLSMPNVNGLEASRELKKLMPAVPIILFTLHADITNILQSAYPSVDRVISKSNAKDLMGHVRSLLPA
jgi:DNA-binding NarL/FixJ family response regulator